MTLARLQLFVKGIALLSILSVVLILVIPRLIPQKKLARKTIEETSQVVLGISTFPTPTPVLVLPSSLLSTTPSPTQIPAPVVIEHIGHPIKTHYSIAVYGDSLEDTMGDRLELLSSMLNQLYPSVTFSLYNYGIGAQNVEQGLDRFGSVFTYKARNYPAITEVKPDIIIIGSYAYNPFSPPDPAKHKLLLTQLVEKAKATGAQVYLIAEVAPLSTDFGKGIHGMTNWTDDFRLLHAKEILDQMNNVFSVAAETKTPLIDVYDKTRSNGPFGSWLYTNTDDGIHPSEKGQSLTAATIAHSLF